MQDPTFRCTYGCGSRSTVVMIPTDEREQHAAHHARQGDLPMREATEVRKGDVLRDPDSGEVVYTVERVLHQDNVHGLQVLVRYAADGGTDVRAFDITKRVPLHAPDA